MIRFVNYARNKDMDVLWKDDIPPKILCFLEEWDTPSRKWQETMIRFVNYARNKKIIRICSK